MTRQITRRLSIQPGPAGKFRQFLTLQAEERVLKKRREEIRDSLRDLAEAEGEIDEDGYGHRIYRLPEPVEFDGKKYAGFRRQRKTSTTFNSDAAEALAIEKGVLEKVQSTEVYIDQDKIYALHQEEVFTEEEVDSLFDENETFAFVPDKA